MITLPPRFIRWASRSGVTPVAIVEVVTSYLIKRLDTKDDWLTGAQVENTPSTTLNGALTAVATTINVAATAGFSIPASASWPGYIVIAGGGNVEVVKYTGATDTSFTGCTRGEYGTTAYAFGHGDTVIQGLISPGYASEPYDLQIQPKNWKQPAFATTKPSLRLGAACCWDSTNNVMWMFGGHDGGAFLNDLWYFDPSAGTWTQVVYTGAAIAGRRYHAMIFQDDYLALGVTMAISGGETAASANGTTDFYTFTITSLASVSAAAETAMPVKKKNHFMGYAPVGVVNSARGAPIIAGGQSDTVANSLKTYQTLWPHGAGLTWTAKLNMNPISGSYGAIHSGPGVWCTRQKKMVCFGNLPGSVSTHHAVFDPVGNTWDATWYGGTMLTPMPTPRHTRSIGVYHPEIHKVIISCGCYSDGAATAYGLFADTWEYDLSGDEHAAGDYPWTQLADYREGRRHATGVWDTESKQLIMWGGSKAETTLTGPTYPDPAMFKHYWGATVTARFAIDVGSVPTNDGNWELDWTEPGYLKADGGYTISFSAEYSDTGTSGPWTSIGDITDNDPITELHRYYRITVVMGSDVDATVKVQKIEARFDNITKLSLAQKAVFGYAPIVTSLPNLGWSIDPVKGTSKGATMTIELVDDEAHSARNLVAGNTIYNKRVRVKLGFYDPADQEQYDPVDINIGYPEGDFVPIFEGQVEDYSWDGRTLVMRCDDNMTQLYKKEIPPDVDAALPSSITYSTAGVTHPVSIILDILQNQINWPDRKLYLNSFTAAEEHATLSGWQFYRVLSKPTKVKKLLEEICRLIGANLIPGEDGKLRIKIYDETEDPVVTITERDLAQETTMEMEWNPDTVKNAVAVYYDITSGDGGEIGDYSAGQLSTNASSATRFDETFTERILSYWLGNVGTYNGDTRADDIAQRIVGRTAFGAPKMKLKTNLNQLGVQVGDIIRTRASVLSELGKLIDTMNQVVPDVQALPYLTFGADRCVDMKWQVIKKTVDVRSKTITWELWRVKYELDQDKTSQADFDEGWGQEIDIEATPGSVQLENTLLSGWYQIDLDLGQQPEEDGQWTLTDTTPGSTTVTYEAWASDTGDFAGEEVSIGTITDADSITVKKRYYRVKATLTGTSGPWTTPTVDRIRAYFEG